MLSGVFFACLIAAINGYRLPGILPVEYEFGQNVTIKVNSLKSVKNVIPFDYYSLMFCRPLGTEKIKAEVQNLGEILRGDIIKPSRYSAQMKQNINCVKVCKTQAKSETKKGKVQYKQLKKLAHRINDEYRAHLLLDSLPVTEVYIWEGRHNSLYYKMGYPIGVPGNKTHPPLVNNHLQFTVKYTKVEGNSYRVVGFQVVPYSVANSKIESECRLSNEDWRPELYPAQPVVDSPAERATTVLSWSYSLKWEEDKETEWVTRWDPYINSSDSMNPKIHWFAIINSLLIVVLLSVMVAGILFRALHKDFNRYNDPENQFEQQEETGWKLVHRDVFRAPARTELLCAYVGTGVQLTCMGFFTLVFSQLGFLSPAHRGALLTMMLVFYVLSGFLAGFTASRLAKMLHKQSWQLVGTVSFYFPSQVFLIFFVIDLLLWSQGASSAVPIGTLFLLLLLWVMICVPLVYIGAIVGFKRDQIQHPLEPSGNPRDIPEQKLQPLLQVLLSGIIPFGAAFIELYFILSSLWQGKIYYVFGFLALVAVIVAVTCAEISIVVTYFQLCYEDYRWWWRAFFASASSGVYLFLYSIFYFFSTLKIKSIISLVVYVGWMFVVSYTFAIITGTIGFLATLVFVRHIYSWVKVS